MTPVQLREVRREKDGTDGAHQLLHPSQRQRPKQALFLPLLLSLASLRSSRYKAGAQVGKSRVTRYDLALALHFYALNLGKRNVIK